MFHNQLKESLTKAYKQLINENNEEFDLTKIADYIKRGADNSVCNEQGHTLLESILLSFKKKVENTELSYLYPQVTVEMHGYIRDMDTKILDLKKIGYQINKKERQLLSELISLLVNKDTNSPNDKNLHEIIMVAVDYLSPLCETKEPKQSSGQTRP